MREIPYRSRLRGIACLAILACACCRPCHGQDDAAFEQWLKDDQAAFLQYRAEVTREYEQFLKEEQEAYQAFVAAAEAAWGKANVWLPERKVWVQYTEDLAERSAIDFEAGVGRAAIVVAPGTPPDEVTALLEQAVERVVVSGTEGPIEMMRRLLRAPKRSAPKRSAPTPQPAPPAAGGSTYVVQKGDTLWGVSKRFAVSRQELAAANGIDPNGWLKIGQRLTIPGAPTPDAVATAPARAAPPLPAAPASRPRIAVSPHPLLTGQITIQNGAPVTAANAQAFARETVRANAVATQPVTGTDGVARQAVEVSFKLVPDHVRVRAERFRPYVRRYAQQYGVYPPLVFAIIHTESSFNPRARSGAPAYGLMQLVPRSGARDAYQFVFKEDKLVTGTYLYDPERNVQLGTAFLHILDGRYFKRVTDPTSRMFCSIAAYNTGAGNVCRAFGVGTSLSRAAETINRMDSGRVYAKLHADLPYEETRNYIRKVRERLPLYTDWN